MLLDEIESTEEVKIPQDPLSRVIGQDTAVRLARIAAKQHRNLLLVGPPGTGKSMIAQALSFYLPRPTEEIRIVHNPANPERPLVEIKKRDEVLKEREEINILEGDIIDPEEAPPNVAERLGFRCPRCGAYSSPDEATCPKCSSPKFVVQGPFGDIFSAIGAAFGLPAGTQRVTTTVIKNGKEEILVYERVGDKIRVLNQKALEKRREKERARPFKTIVPIDRNTFVMATGASETELLGDVRHDPYGGRPPLGSLPYERVTPGAIHEAHEGVLFIDEITHLGPLQRHILTALQEKKFPITGRNPQSAGASVRVDDVPCDFILVAACNIADINYILPPLRSRIVGDGYEILMETTMPNTPENRDKYVQFIAQEISMDGKIPHAKKDAILAIIEEGRRRAKLIDNENNALTLRLRDLGGLIRVAGDLAREEGCDYIREKHVKMAIKIAEPIEEKIVRKYGSMERAYFAEKGVKKEHYYWNVYEGDAYH